MLEIEPVTHSCQLRDVYVKKIIAERLCEELPDTAPKLGIHTDCDSRLISPLHGIGLLTIKFEFEEEDSRLFILEFTLAGEFEREDDSDINNEKFLEFMKISCFTLLWPYARELTSSTLNRMGFPPLNLPTINVPATTKRNLKEEVVKD
ncbi:MAG TPA: hypothetical protein GX520_03785 [Syntrophaceticus sp.]|jgi:preprotein translocase subunit SecB|nr:hypothetical protein [Syntrophaceticus sp.]